MASQNPNKNHEDSNSKRSDPIPITSPFRRRSASVSSNSSGSSSELPTPLSGSGSSQRVSIPSPGSSPILSYFLAQSPTAKGSGLGTFPFAKRFGVNPPVYEEAEAEVPAAAHARRASATVAGRFTQSPNPTVPDPRQERGTGLLRRLSLSSSTFKQPTHDQGSNAPPNTAVSPTMKDAPFSRDSRQRRSATLSVDTTSRPRRAPSPMGERILKGHFDGFN
ncbi:hypothetical protein BDN71DRAFT_1452464 [Pleurotus eryngii]|uniref:Uncharacterized protein n=1 Tax=Pleurotus eryngii TaxID=5323 RepID=A0A9P5ZNW8_PLEER|nr:hypothetical protein BDN71DRAFT_1452464 [Pleurotus eryngii]